MKEVLKLSWMMTELGTVMVFAQGRRESVADIWRRQDHPLGNEAAKAEQIELANLICMANQIAIAFKKYASGCRPGDPAWNALDQEALNYAKGDDAYNAAAFQNFEASRSVLPAAAGGNGWASAAPVSKGGEHGA